MSRDERAAERVPAPIERPNERPNERIGRYEVLRKIATGGMAELFLAKHVGMEGFEKLVAIKRILAHLAYDEEFVNMFRDEARLVAKLAHPNIVEIYDLGKSSDSYFIAMEYIAGRNLATVAKRARNRGEGMPPVNVARCLAQACEALYYAHTRLDEKGRPMGIVHRDVSPQNIIVSFSGNVKLVDFGIAKAATKIAHTRAGVLKGKYAYMSPEQIRGEEIDARSDVFAVGIVLFELLCGRRPFEKETAIQTLKSIVQEPHVDPRTLLPSLPDGLAAIINRCLVKRRDQRYQSAQEAQVALEDFVASSGERVNNASIGAWMTGLFADELDRQKVGTVNVKGVGEVLLPPSERHEPSEELDVSVDEDSAAEPSGATGVPESEDATGAARIPGTSIRGGGSLREPTIQGRRALLEEGVIGRGGAPAPLPDEATQHANDVGPAPTIDLEIGAVHHGPLGHVRPAYAEVDRGAATVPPGTAPSTRPRPASPAPAYDDGLTQAATEERLESLRALSRPPDLSASSGVGSNAVSAVTDLGASAFGLPPAGAAFVASGEDTALGSEDPTVAPDDDLWGDKTTAEPSSAAEYHDDEIQLLEPDAQLEPSAHTRDGDAEWGDATRKGGDGFGFEATLGGDALAARSSYAPPAHPSLEPWGEKTTANPEDPAEGGEGGARTNGIRLFDAANWSDVSRGTIEEGPIGEEATNDWGSSEDATVGATEAWRVPQPTSNVLRLGELPLPPAVDGARDVELDSATVAATSGRLRDAGFAQPPPGAFAFDAAPKSAPEPDPDPARRAAIGALKLGKAPAVPRGGVREANSPGTAPSTAAPPAKPTSSNEVLPRARSLSSAPPRTGSVASRPPAPPYPSEDVIRSAQRSGVELMPASAVDRSFSLGGPERPAMPRAPSHFSTENEGPLPPGGALLTPLSVDSSTRPAPIKPLVGADPLASIGSTRVPPASVSLSEMLLDTDENLRGSQPLKPASMIRGTPMSGVPARSTSGATLPPPARGASYAGGLGLPEASTFPPGAPSPNGYGVYGQAPIGGMGFPGTTAGVAGAAGRLTGLREIRRAPSRSGSLTGLPAPLAEGVAPPTLGTPGIPQPLAPPRARLTRNQAIIIALSAVIVAALLGALLFLRFRAPSLEITTQPPGAQVYVADRLMDGVTPLSFSIEPEVDYPVRVVRAGFETHNQTVRLPRGKRAWTATINLRPLVGGVGAGTSTAAGANPPQ